MQDKSNYKTVFIDQKTNLILGITTDIKCVFELAKYNLDCIFFGMHYTEVAFSIITIENLESFDLSYDIEKGLDIYLEGEIEDQNLKKLKNKILNFIKKYEQNIRI